MLKRSKSLRAAQAVKKPSGRDTYSLTPSGLAVLNERPLRGDKRPLYEDEPPLRETVTLDEMLTESVTSGELGRAARRAHAVLADRAGYRVEHVEAALLSYLPVLLSDQLDHVADWTQGPAEGRPSAFNRHLQEARRQLR